jgi:hypothetical protein
MHVELGGRRRRRKVKDPREGEGVVGDALYGIGIPKSRFRISTRLFLKYLPVACTGLSRKLVRTRAKINRGKHTILPGLSITINPCLSSRWSIFTGVDVTGISCLCTMFLYDPI